MHIVVVRGGRERCYALVGEGFLLARGGVSGRPDSIPPYTYFCFFSAGLRISYKE
jgi:hypothetical protein